MNVDTHTPFKGYDIERYYNKFTRNWENETDYDIRMRSADYYFGRLINYVSKFNNNTIVVLTGDHGARERPLYGADEHVTDSSVFSQSCVHKIFGNDNLFTTSGVIADLSGNILDPDVVGLTSKITADHDDLITTLKDILFGIAGK